MITLAHQKQDIVAHSVNTKMHLEIYKLAISFREEFMASKNLIGEKFMIPCQNIHPCQVALLYFMPERKRETIHLLESDFFHGVETSSLYKSKSNLDSMDT